MKILYAIQGTGNGHLTRARDIIPALQKKGEVDILVSGSQSDVDLPFSITYKFDGLSFVSGKNGGIDYLQTYKRSNLKRLFKEIRELPVENYDLVISDFEPVSAWACYIKKIACIGLSHQAAVASNKSPKPGRPDLLGLAILKYYAPAQTNYGFHFLPYGKNIFTPVIRTEVRELQKRSSGHYTVYLPAYSDKKILKLLSRFKHIEWQVFSKNATTTYDQENISICPIHNRHFLQSISGAAGVLCGAGFETPAEVLFLGKKLMVVPMKGQYEQQCNAAALQLLGIPVIKNIKRKQAATVKHWIEEESFTTMSFPDETQQLVDSIFNDFKLAKRLTRLRGNKPVKTASGFRELVIKKIFSQLK